jgi:NADPH-dependent glutamate synthase beta subunit-like oxidoreductase/ferredoxin
MSKDDRLPPEYVLSRVRGHASAPKDFAWVQKNIPCQAACPAGTDIPAYLNAIAQGDDAAAYRINLRDNVFPGVLGRVCTRPCEPVCRHGWEGLGEPVAICAAKRAAADDAEQGGAVVLDPVFPPSGKRVAVVGAGAAGLTVARELALWGHAVTVFERDAVPGGLMVQGIPAFRLPRAVVALEIDQIRQLGVDIRCGVAVGADVSLAALAGEYDGTVIASGTQKPYWPDWPGIELAGVEHGLEFLRRSNAAGAQLSGKVVVVGGGFTAVDCARVARRAGATGVAVVYRRSLADMYIGAHEIAEMEREGITFTPLTMPVGCEGREGRVTGVRMVAVTPGAPDASGRPQPVPVPDSEQVWAADHVLLATGQRLEVEWMDADIRDRILGADGLLTGTDAQTRLANLFVAGDFAMGALSLIDAIGHARACARRVDQFLMGRDRWREVVAVEDAETTGRERAMDFIPRQPMPMLSVTARGMTDEVETGYAPDAAQQEARRCYLCHFKYEIDNELCIYCDRCLKVMPVDRCIVKISGLEYDAQGRISGWRESTSVRDYKLLFIDQNECIRCGACAEVCPVECISLQKVSPKWVAERGVSSGRG